MEHPLATAADGTARRMLKLAKGARTLFVPRGPIVSATPSPPSSLTVSGDDDPQRLLLLIDRRGLQGRRDGRGPGRLAGTRRPWPW